MRLKRSVLGFAAAALSAVGLSLGHGNAMAAEAGEHVLQDALMDAQANTTLLGESMRSSHIPHIANHSKVQGIPQGSPLETASQRHQAPPKYACVTTITERTSYPSPGVPPTFTTSSMRPPIAKGKSVSNACPIKNKTVEAPGQGAQDPDILTIRRQAPQLSDAFMKQTREQADNGELELLPMPKREESEIPENLESQEEYRIKFPAPVIAVGVSTMIPAATSTLPTTPATPSQAAPVITARPAATSLLAAPPARMPLTAIPLG